MTFVAEFLYVVVGLLISPKTFKMC